VCERGPVAQVLNKPEHPYTQRLLDAAPSVTGALVHASIHAAPS
jgi:ABC-type dipeptide/oligopeptide/nickel transport system ATPase component